MYSLYVIVYHFFAFFFSEVALWFIVRNIKLLPRIGWELHVNFEGQSVL